MNSAVKSRTGPDKPAKRQHTRKEIRDLKPDVRRLLKYGTELELMQFLREIGIKDEDPRFATAVRAYRDLKSGKL